ncbi:glutathione S-transferase family protein [Litorivivens sp.]|uniref:glutathione S-transferase family protein n=1 Tax=Litorivivens sp. TaxID=2020868 RepID=UPI0035652FD5
MTDPMILHHYDGSPYAEKVRLMFGLTNSHWYSMLSPAWPPRPSLDPLTGGYRRIPVAQSGADIFCDTALISREVAAATQCEALNPQSMSSEAAALMQQAEKEAFFAAIGAVPPLRLVGTMIRKFGPVGMYRFVKDRSGLLKGGSARAPQREAAGPVLQALLDALEQRLGAHTWINGESPSVADLAAYHPLWLHVNCNRRPLQAGPKVLDWFQRVGDIGHGSREEISQSVAFAAAKDSEPRALPASVENVPVAIGTRVEVAPSDYGVQPVKGILAAVTDERIIVARDTDEFGKLHVHFPREGYSVKVVQD